MLQFLNRDKTYFTTLESHSFKSFTYGEENTVGIVGDPEIYLGKICSIHIDGNLLGSGIVTGYNHDKDNNSGDLFISPLTIDLLSDFVTSTEYDTDISNILESIINQYISSVSNPLLYVKSKTLAGKNLKYSFSLHESLLDAFSFIKNKFIGTTGNILIEADGGVTIGRAPITHEFTYGNDILSIKYEKDSSEIVNYIFFTNNVDGANHIEKTYQDANSIATYGNRVKFISDERFIYEASADEYCAGVLAEKGSPKIVVQAIKTTRNNVNIGDKISISNWEKNFDDELFVNKIKYQDGIYNLDIGTNQTKTDLLNL